MAGNGTAAVAAIAAAPLNASLRVSLGMACSIEVANPAQQLRARPKNKC
jgi:hypothetical protein